MAEPTPADIAAAVGTIANGLQEALREIAALHRRIEEIQGELTTSTDGIHLRLRAISRQVGVIADNHVERTAV